MNQQGQQFIADTSFISPLGLSAMENFHALLEGKSGIQLVDNPLFFPTPILASVMQPEKIEAFKNKFKVQTRFDALLLACVEDILQKSLIDYANPDTLIILSTTKGNIELLATDPNDARVNLNYSASLIQQKLQNPNPVFIVSNACISGVSASIIAKRYLDAKLYEHVLVIGCDAVSNFVLSGFNSFHAISKKGCRPFDRARDGVVLGEACGAILFSATLESDISILGGTISNDANHISGPSKTGDELSYCIAETLKHASVETGEISFISAHGTATPYNDEMESKAIANAGLHTAPVFSLKGHYGHTLGASGIIESIISMECLKSNRVLPSFGFEVMGVSGDIQVNTLLIEKDLRYALKTASGFGGCNAAMLLKKNR